MTRGLLAALLLASTAAHAEQDWFTLSVDGLRTGYAVEERRVDHGVVIEHAATMVVVRQLGHRGRIGYDATLRSDGEGHPLTFDFKKDTGTDREEWHGVFDGKQLVIRQHQDTQWKETRIDVPAGAILSPLRQARMVARGDVETRIVFSPQTKTFATIRITRDDAHSIRAHFADDASEQIRLDDDGRIVEVQSRLMAHALAWTPCARDCNARVSEPMDAIGALVVRSPVRIPAWYRHRRIRYVLSRTDGREPDAVETFEQNVVRDGSRAVLTVCDDCGSEAVASAADIARFLQPNAWVRSDDAQIRRIARGAVGGANVHESMRSLTKFVALAMHGNNDFIGYADAVTALRTGSGDCTEFAVLLAALARARGIPARIAVGLAYSDRFSGRKDVFSPHMWVQAWDGTHWTSYDAALENFDSTHIALAIGDGDPASVNAQFATLPMLRIEKAGALREP